ncbi:hypothetical protein [Nonomuraea jabiensis]|uniref:hypothetical protein n=1 Tax=Nonomuraea jabiensis TaxID=882448 RepID=UPI003D74B906
MIDLMGAKFFSFTPPPPSGDWEYVLDDYGVIYRRGWWPFANAVSGRPCSVRISPDTEYRAWGGQYVLVWPDRDNTALFTSRILVHVRTQGFGVLAVPVNPVIDLRTRQIVIPSSCPESLREKAAEGAGRLLRFVQNHRHARTTRNRPETAHERWITARADQ